MLTETHSQAGRKLQASTSNLQFYETFTDIKPSYTSLLTGPDTILEVNTQTHLNIITSTTYKRSVAMASNASSPNPGKYSPAMPSDNSPTAASPIMERPPSPDLPLTMTASTVLMNLPRDATAALASAGAFPSEKIIIRFKPVGSAPAVKNERSRVLSTQKFDFVVAYLRKQLRVSDTESVFLYINNTFAPALDEVVGNLWRVSHACLKLAS